MRWVNSFIIAFSMFSKIPMPEREWNKESMKYIFCFFPLIGVVIGGLVYISAIFAPSRVILAALTVIIPLFITGGIHMDGYSDVIDAVACRGSMEKKRQVLKDSNVGAFAAIGLVIYYLLYFAFASELMENTIGMLFVAVGFVVSRVVCGLGMVNSSVIKGNGLGKTFAEGSSRKRVTVFLAVLLGIIAIFLIKTSPAYTALLALGIITAGLYSLLYVKKQLGGISGDVAGHFIAVSELLVLILVAVGGSYL